MNAQTFRLLPLVLALSGGTALTAQSTNGHRNDGSRRDSFNNAYFRQYYVDAIDENARELSEREQTAQKHSQKAALPSAVNFDTNHDGRLDEKELAGWEKAVRAAADRSPAVLQRFDTNHDGKLDDAEWAVFWMAVTTTIEQKK